MISTMGPRTIGSRWLNIDGIASWNNLSIGRDACN